MWVHQTAEQLTLEYDGGSTLFLDTPWKGTQAHSGITFAFTSSGVPDSSNPRWEGLCCLGMTKVGDGECCWAFDGASARVRPG